MSLTFERWYPVIYAMASMLLAYMLSASLPKSDSYLAGLLSASISASAISIGFIATAKSILIALPSDFRNQLKNSNYMGDLARYLNEAMTANIIFCTLNIAGFFTTFQENLLYVSPIWIGIGVFCIATFWRVGRVMVAILESN